MKEKKEMGLLLLFSVVVGFLVGSLEVLFGKGLIIVTQWRESDFNHLILFLPMIGLLIVYLYDRFSLKAKEGMGLVIKAGRGMEEEIPTALIPLIMISTWLTHLFGGSAGREGVAVQIGGTLSHRLSKVKKLEGFNSREISRRAVMIGMAAGFSGLFQTPLAAIFFVLEVVLIGKWDSWTVLSVTLASFTAYGISKGLGLEKFSFNIQESLSLSPTILIQLIILGIIFGLVGSFFVISLKKMKLRSQRWLPNSYQRIFFGGIILAVLVFTLREGRYAGLGTNLIDASLTGGEIYPTDFLWKILLTILTLAIGFQGGEVTPLFAIGSSLGILLAPLFGLPIVIVVAIGYIAVFGSATNTFFAPVLIGAEVFGFHLVPFFALAMLAAYFSNFNQSIYEKKVS